MVWPFVGSPHLSESRTMVLSGKQEQGNQKTSNNQPSPPSAANAGLTKQIRTPF